ncbi:MAG: hypothetical protein Q4C65_04420 [Eubacteriales bacterium]|nr:hypothetical protein [Eubacteriales bacterium]
MKKNSRAGILFLTIMMLWGIIYPQYALTREMYQVEQDGRRLAQDAASDYGRILTAKPGEVELRFGLLERIEEWFGEKE